MSNLKFMFCECRCRCCMKPVNARLHRKICTDLSVKYAYVCPECGCVGCVTKDKIWINNKVVEGQLDADTIATMPVLNPDNVPLCARCGEPGAQNHHWAPDEIFDDSELWPQNYLCDEHHKAWHRAIEQYYAGKAAGVDAR